MKKILSVILVITFIFCSCSYSQNEIDFSDIEKMNIGAEMPKVIYADNEKAIFFGCFGIIVYDLENKCITDRVTEELAEIWQKNIFYDCDASKDGRYIYISYIDFSFDEEYDGYYHIYDTEKRKFKDKHIAYNGVVVFEDTYVDSFDENTLYFPYLDSVKQNHGISETIAETDYGFVALRSDTWNAKDLQVAICDYQTGKVEIFDLFEL